MKGGLFLYIFFSLFCGSLLSQTRAVSLKECIDIALENHPDIMISMESHKQAAADYRVAKSQNSVLINAEAKTVEILKSDTSMSDSNLNVPGRDTSFGIFAGITATYNLIDPKKSKKEQYARLAVDLAKIDSIRVKNLIVYNVKKFYYGYLFARENELLKQNLVEKFKIKLKKAEILFRNGQRPILDVSKARVDFANSTLEYEKARNYVNLRKTELLGSMGIMDEDIAVSPVTVKALPDLQFSLKELYHLAENYYSEIRIARFKKEMSRIKIVVERAGHDLRVDIMASIGMENRDLQGKDDIGENFQKDKWEPTVHAGLKAKFPIYAGGGISGKVDSAISEYNKYVYYERKILMKTRARIRNYIQLLNEFKKQMEILQLVRENAKKYLMLVQRSWEKGIGSQLDMPDAEMAVSNAEINFLKAKYDYSITLAGLSNVVGLKEENLCKKSQR